MGSSFGVSYLWNRFRHWLSKSLWRRVLAGFLAILFTLLIGMYAIAQWYLWTGRDKPIELGATFVPNYARYFGIEPVEVYSAMLNDLEFKRIRLVSYWSNMEQVRGTYDFSELDWQFRMAEEKNVKISLAVGLRQPRWPECHMPVWATDLSKEQWYPELLDFMAATVERYKDSPVLESYQLENEFLLTVFGDCPDHDRERLIEEFEYLRRLDPTKPIIVNRSNNATPSWPIGEPRADKIGAAVYKRVWDKTVSKRYFEYPIPAWYYAFLAGGTKLTTGRETFLHELQAEPWLPDGYDLRTASIKEQDYTMDAKRLHHRFEYGRATGLKTIDLWGVEWWYYRLKQGDDSLWRAAKEEIQKTETHNAKL